MAEGILSTRIMIATRKDIKADEHKIINTETCSCNESAQHLLIRNIRLMSHKLSLGPTASFDDHGDMRLAASKATLKKALKVDTAQRPQPRPIDVTVLDGCTASWAIPWSPSGSAVQNKLDQFRRYLHTQQADVFLVFDRCVQSTTKDTTSASRDNKSSRLCTL